MKTIRTILPPASAVLAVCMLAGIAQAGISGSKHDFGQFGWAKNQICLPCHAPHNTTVKDANGVVVGGPLWNHTLSTATYDLYYDSNGAKVTNVSMTTRKRPARLISIPAATCNAPCSEAC